MRPIVDLQQSGEVADLKAAGVYVAGVVDPAAKNKTEFYDVLVDGLDFFFLVFVGGYVVFRTLLERNTMIYSNSFFFFFFLFTSS